MKLGISSYTYTWACGVPGHVPARPMTALDLCRRAGELGVSVVQLCENAPVPNIEFAELLQNSADSGLKIEWGTRGLNEAQLTEITPRLTHFESDFVRLVVDHAGHEPSPAQVVDRLRVWLKGLPANVSIALENHDRFPAQAIIDIIERVDRGRVGITLDTVNSFGALEGPQHVVETLAPYVLSLHVKDFTIRRVPSQMGFVIEGCPAGEGRLDIPWLLGCLHDAGRDPNAIIELWTPPADTLEETIAREAEWAKRSVEYMRTLIPD